MKRNTPTTLGALRVGDRFYFPNDKSKKAHQLTIQPELKSHKPSYNVVFIDGKKAWPFDRQFTRDKEVVFLRHTIPAPGDECMLYDLQKGDVFFLPGNVVFEYLIVDTEGLNPKEKYLVEGINSEDNKLFWQKNIEVVYVRKSTNPIDAKKIAKAPFNH